MTRNKLIIGSVGLVAIAAFFAVSLWNNTSFKELNHSKNKSEIKKQSSIKKAVSASALNNSKEESLLQNGNFEIKNTISSDKLVADNSGVENLNQYKKKSALDAMQWIKDRYLDLETGTTITHEKLTEIRKQISKLPSAKSMSFTECGPNNIGGRTRAICVDKTNNNRLWAGGVSGGLFVSNNRAVTWERVTEYIAAGAAPFISSITQTDDGTLYVASGSFDESWNGNGVYYSTDFGTTWTLVPGTGSFNTNEVVSSDVDNYAWMATSSGVKKWKVGDASLTSITVTPGSCSNIQISKDGTVLVAALGAKKTYVSTDGGGTWTDKSGSASSNLVPTGAIRNEYAISPERNSSNNYSLYAVRTNSNLLSMHVSHDNGTTWSQFVGASGSPSTLDIYQNQGWYNTIVSVVPNNPEKILIGGLDIWQWEQITSSPPAGGFEKISLASQWGMPDWGPKYNHADNHEMEWDAVDRLYVGNDGGISVTDNFGETWHPFNRGYNVTQFYGVAFDRDGSVFGGTQDNGSLLGDNSFADTMEFREVFGGDGFETEISFWNPKIMFAGSQEGNISRSSDKGATWEQNFHPTYPSTYDGFPFHTEFVLAEYYDLDSKDSVIYTPRANYAANSTLRIPSASSGDTINYVTPVALYYDDTLYYEPSQTILDVSVVNGVNGQNVHLGNFTWTPFPSATGTNPPTIGDSLMVDFPSGPDTVVVTSLGTYNHYFAQNSATGELYDLQDDTIAYDVCWNILTIQDPYQSWYLVFVDENGGELWGTRNALRLSAQSTNWVKVITGIGNGNIDIEFSKDLNHCYISAGTNGVWRLDSLGSIYTSDPDFKTKVGYSGATFTTPPSGTSKIQMITSDYEAIAVNPNNADDLILFAGFSGVMRRSSNATSAAPTFPTTIPSITTPAIACYDGIIDRDNPNILVVGTAEGVFVTENNGTDWLTASTGFEGTPVYEVRQSWRTWDEGNARPGEIYIATHGRGIWKSSTYLGIEENGNDANTEIKNKLKMYPNPTMDNTTLVFNLDQTSDVTVNVYNISGMLVLSSSNKNVEAGAQEFVIDSSNLPKGTYIVKVNAGILNETAKFIKM